jgi:hypothetical protein
MLLVTCGKFGKRDKCAPLEQANEVYGRVFLN